MLLAVLALALHAAPSTSPDLCAADSSAVELRPSRSLFCIDLVPVPDLRQLHGTVELRRASSPFTVAVDAEGHQQYDLVVSVPNLPAPRTLGPFTTYVAWATTPTFSAETKLGALREGRTAPARVGYDKFIVIISAERSADVQTRGGKMVMRATSPSWLLLPHDGAKLPARSEASEHAGHHMSESGWVMPPMHPQVPTMVAGLELLEPPERPWLPGAGRDSSSIPIARPREVVALKDGDSLDLEAMLVRRKIAGRTIMAYGFNGQTPGPLIRVGQKATVVVNFTNHLDQPTSVHWHGIRLDNRFDGVPHVTQELVPPGGRFRYVIRFPDAGIYWYHSHHREDAQQDLGLYGNLFVRPERDGWLGRVHREEVLMLDDFLVGEDGAPVPYGEQSATHALMGRFGNVMLVNGAPDWSMRVSRGEVVRFYLTNASNTRVFNLGIPGARLKLVGGDGGRVERERWVESVVLAPAERWIVDARFDVAGKTTLVNRVRAIDHFAGQFFSEVDTLGVITVEPARAAPEVGAEFATLRSNPAFAAELARLRAAIARPPDKTLQLTLDPGKQLPFGLIQALRLDTGYVNPVEWSGTMPMMDWLPVARDMRWVLRDVATGRENMDIDWTFGKGDLVRIRLVNDRHTLHPMSHPLHIHGQRFLVLAVNAEPMTDRVWKDTVLLPTGSTIDLLVEMSNSGRWMMHCHIAEHLESGMHAVFEVK